MKVLHLNAGNETGGGMHHILQVLGRMRDKYPKQNWLGLMEKKELYKRATANHIDAIYFRTSLQMTPAKLRLIAAYMKEHHITHVHTHGPRANVYMNMLRKFVRTNWITTIHSNPYEDFKGRGVYGRMLTKMHLHAIKYANKIITVSEGFQPLLRGAGCKDSQMTLIHNGIDFYKTPDSTAITRRSLGFNEDDFIMVQVARLHPVKAHHIAFEALQSIHHRFPQIHLLLIGDGPLRQELTIYARELGLEDNIHFIGEVPNPDAYYQLADLTLLTSYSESFPYVLLESARAQTPVITSAVGDITQLVNSKEKGWIVPVNDVSAVETAIVEGIQQKTCGNLENMGQNLKKYASAHFSLDKCVEEVYNVYEGL